MSIMSPNGSASTLGTLERGFSTSAADLNELVDDDGIDMSQFEGGDHTEGQAGKASGRLNTSDNAQDQVAAEHRVKQRNDALRKQLAMMQVVLAEKTTKIKTFAYSYVASHTHRESHRPQPFENDPSDSAEEEDGGTKVPEIPAREPEPVDANGADGERGAAAAGSSALDRRSSLGPDGPLPAPITGHKARRKGSVKTQTIVEFVRSAPQDLKQRLFQLPRFTHLEIEKIKAACQPKLLNGMISKALFKTIIGKVARAKVNNATKYASVVFELLDLSSIGFIRMKDLKFLLAIFCDGSPGLRLRELFLSFDTDGDGQMSPAELTQLVAMINALRPSSYKGVLDDEQLSEMLMLELDVDGDGEISCEEFVYQSQGNDKLTDVFLGVVDGFHKAEASRRKQASLEGGEEGEEGTIDKFGAMMAEFGGGMFDLGEDDEDFLNGFMSVDTSTAVAETYKCIHKDVVYMRSEPRLKKKTDISVAPDELVESTGTCIGDKGVVFIELAAREHGSGYYPLNHPKTKKAMFEVNAKPEEPEPGFAGIGGFTGIGGGIQTGPSEEDGSEYETGSENGSEYETGSEEDEEDDAGSESGGEDEDDEDENTVFGFD